MKNGHYGSQGSYISNNTIFHDAIKIIQTQYNVVKFFAFGRAMIFKRTVVIMLNSVWLCIFLLGRMENRFVGGLVGNIWFGRCQPKSQTKPKRTTTRGKQGVTQRLCDVWLLRLLLIIFCQLYDKLMIVLWQVFAPLTKY